MVENNLVKVGLQRECNLSGLRRKDVNMKAPGGLPSQAVGIVVVEASLTTLFG
jgi:hypothetical protein